MQLTAELLEKVKAWKESGDRCAKVTLERGSGSWEIWLYDYSLAAGMILNDSNTDSDWERIILTKKRNDLAKELEKIDDKLGGAA